MRRSWPKNEPDEPVGKAHKQSHTYTRTERSLCRSVVSSVTDRGEPGVARDGGERRMGAGSPGETLGTLYNISRRL
jgi:hypothetical protein